MRRMTLKTLLVNSLPVIAAAAIFIAYSNPQNLPAARQNMRQSSLRYEAVPSGHVTAPLTGGLQSLVSPPQDVASSANTGSETVRQKAGELAMQEILASSASANQAFVFDGSASVRTSTALSDWNNQKYDASRPESIDIKLPDAASVPAFCNAGVAVLEARVTNGWPAQYSMYVSLWDASGNVVKSEDPVSNYFSRSRVFVVPFNQVRPGTYFLMAQSQRKEQSRDSPWMAAARKITVVGCGDGVEGPQLLSSEGFSISAVNGAIMVNAYLPVAVSSARLYILVGGKLVEAGESFTEKFKYETPLSVPYSVQVVVTRNEVVTVLAGNFKPAVSPALRN